MITVKEAKGKKAEIQKIIDDIKENDKFRKVKKVEVKTEDGDYVAWFTLPTRKQYKAFNKQYKDNPSDIVESIALSNVIYPDNGVFKEFVEYNYGILLNIGNTLFKEAGFDSVPEIKNA